MIDTTPARTLHPRAAALTLGFGASVCTAVTWYVARLPGVMAPGWLLVLALAGWLILAGVLAGWYTRPAVKIAAWAGLISSIVNLLMVGSVFSDMVRGGESYSSTVKAVAGALLLLYPLPAMLLCMLGAWLASRRTAWLPQRSHINWPACFCLVACLATWLLIGKGGAVTGAKAGLAVPDWPGSFGYNMVLFPLSKMTGSIYLEHAHRLMGMLVGLTTLSVCIYLWSTRQRRAVNVLAGAALVMVIVQGVMGGLRVTRARTGGEGTGIEVAAGAHETIWSLPLAIAHGVLGQLFLATLVTLAVWTTRRYAQASTQDRRVPADGILGVMLVVGLSVQLVLGALQRHTNEALIPHVSMAVAVLAVALATGLRCVWLGAQPDRLDSNQPDAGPWLRNWGRALLGLVAMQMLLGLVATGVSKLESEPGVPHVADVLFTTLHQLTGATLLAVAAGTMWWMLRLVRPPRALLL